MDRDRFTLSSLALQVLRLHPEPHEYWRDAVVHDHLTSDPGAYMRFIAERLQQIAAGTSTVELPSKAIFNDGADGGDFRVMPCVFRAPDMVVKTVKIVGTNVTQEVVPDQITVGRAFRLHPNDNFITHTFEACLLSSARTGACIAMAAALLAPRRRKITIVGAGRVGYYAARYLVSQGGVESLTFCDLIGERAAAVAALMREESAPGLECVSTVSLPAQSDIVVFATTSTVPSWRSTDCSAGLVISVGADTEEQRELDSSWTTSDLYTDSGDSMRVGDLRAWHAEGAITGDEVMDLLTLLRQGPRQLDGRARVFVSTGSALFDNLTIAYLLHGGAKDHPG